MSEATTMEKRMLFGVVGIVWKEAGYMVEGVVESV